MKHYTWIFPVCCVELYSPVKFPLFILLSERLPKWSVLRRSESNPLSPPQPSLRPSASAELLNQIAHRSPLRGSGDEEGFFYHNHHQHVNHHHQHNQHSLVTNTSVNTIISSRDSPQTPPVSVFDRRRSWFTSRAAPGVTRPRVLKHGPVLPLDLASSRNTDLQSLKRWVKMIHITRRS